MAELADKRRSSNSDTQSCWQTYTYLPHQIQRRYARSSLEVGRTMTAAPVNLDALIRREDFEIAIDPNKIQPVEESPKMKIVELENDSFMFRRLRKPDFQRT